MTRTLAAPPAPGRRDLLIAGAALVAGCAGIESVPAPAAPVPPPRVRVGDRWRYAKLNLYNGTQVAALTAQVLALEPRLTVGVTDADGARHADEVYAGAWRVLQEPAYDLVQIFREPVPVLPATLQVGARESTKTTYTLAAGSQAFYWSEKLDAVRWERVRVPAGEFDALRIERRIGFTHSELWRQLSQRTETLWYAPAVNRWVQRNWTGTYYWPGMRRAPLHEDSVGWRLLEYAPAA